MPDQLPPVQNFRVFRGTDFRVANGANLGDDLVCAEDIMLDDIYALEKTAAPVRLALHMSRQAFSVADTTEVGVPDALVFLDAAMTLMSPDGATLDALILVELTDEKLIHASYILPLAPLATKTDYAVVGLSQEGARKVLAQTMCVSFSRGTHITLANGAQTPIEALQIGDRVLTRDAGPQVIRWIGQTTARATGETAPIRIAAGTLNNTHDLIVSPNHRLFIYQRADTVGVGRSEVLVRAKDLVNGTSVTVQDGGFVDYFQILFDDHHIIFAEGIAAESFLVDAQTAPVLPDGVKTSLGEQTAHTTTFSGFDLDPADAGTEDLAEKLRRASQG